MDVRRSKTFGQNLSLHLMGIHGRDTGFSLDGVGFRVLNPSMASLLSGKQDRTFGMTTSMSFRQYGSLGLNALPSTRCCTIITSCSIAPERQCRISHHARLSRWRMEVQGFAWVDEIRFLVCVPDCSLIVNLCRNWEHSRGLFPRDAFRMDSLASVWISIGSRGDSTRISRCISIYVFGCFECPEC